MTNLSKLAAACGAYEIETKICDQFGQAIEDESQAHILWFEALGDGWDGITEDGLVLVLLLDALDRAGWKWFEIRSVPDGFITDARLSREDWATAIQGGGVTRTEAVAAAFLFAHEGFPRAGVAPGDRA